MRHAWNACFDGPITEEGEGEDAGVTDGAIAAVTAETPIAALPLSTRARSALDRAGLSRAGDLRALPDNRLSAIRGAGRQVAQDNHDFRTRWQALVPASAAPRAAFFPGYHGEDLIVETALAAEAAAILSDAGIRTLAQLAATPTEQLDGLASRYSLDVDAIRRRLSGENRLADERDRPTTLEGGRRPRTCTSRSAGRARAGWLIRPSRSWSSGTRRPPGQTSQAQPHSHTSRCGDVARTVPSRRACRTSRLVGSNTMTSLTPWER